MKRSILVFDRCLSTKIRNVPFVERLKIDIGSKMKTLIDANRFQEALTCFDQQHSPDDRAITMALKALQCQDDQTARQIFNEISNKTVYDYAAILKGFCSNGMYEDALDLFEKMTIQPDQVILTILFKISSRLTNQRAFNIAKGILDKIPKSFFNDPILVNSAIDMLFKCADIERAELLFHELKIKTAFTYDIIMKGFNLNKMAEKTLHLYEQITIEPNEFIVTNVFNACAQIGDDRALNIGKAILDQIPKHFSKDTFLVNSALTMLIKCGDIQSAEHYFHQIKTKNVFTYRTMMNGFNLNKMAEKTLRLYEQITIEPNEFIVTNVFNACAQIGDDRSLNIGKAILDKIPKHFSKDMFLVNSALTMLIKCGDIQSAEHYFHQIKTTSVFTYSTMMNGFNLNKMAEKTLRLYEQIPIEPNEFIATNVFNACAQIGNDRALNIGKKLFNKMSKLLTNDVVTLTSFLDMLMKCGDIDNAERLFARMKHRNVIIYSVMMNGYNENDQAQKCLSLFDKMKEEKILPDETTYVLLVGACSQLGFLRICQSIVEEIPSSLMNNPFLQTALIAMWGKAGSIKNALGIFQSIEHPCLITMTAMIHAYGVTGNGRSAIELYRTIPADMINDQTRVCILNACSHAGLLAEACSIFDNISNPNPMVVTAMVDCFSRSFRFDEAEKLIQTFESENEPYIVMHMALLSGARVSKNLELSKRTFDRMKNLFPNVDDDLISGSILLANTYSSSGDQVQAFEIRQKLSRAGKKFKLGITQTDINGIVESFHAHDQSHPRCNEIFAELGKILDELVNHGHEFDSNCITRPLKADESIRSVVGGHSEKIALAYNFIQDPVPSPIQLVKNLRVCEDCHKSTKLIAKIRQCTIIVRDANRVHEFSPDGHCSCNDHF